MLIVVIDNEKLLAEDVDEGSKAETVADCSTEAFGKLEMPSDDIGGSVAIPESEKTECGDMEDASIADDSSGAVEMTEVSIGADTVGDVGMNVYLNVS